MSFKDLKITTYQDSVSALPDYPSDAGITAAQLKAVFDGRTDKEIKQKFNALIDELITKFGLVEVDIADAVEDHNQDKGAHDEIIAPIHTRIAEILAELISMNISIDGKADELETKTQLSALDLFISGTTNELHDHTSARDNPHKVTAEQVGAVTEDDMISYVGNVMFPLQHSVDDLLTDINFKADKSELSGYVKNTDYATHLKAGIAKVMSPNGVDINNGFLHIACCSKAEIDARENSVRPIVPSNLEYAVKSVGDGYYATEKQVGDIDTALDELHSYAQNLVGGDAE